MESEFTKYAASNNLEIELIVDVIKYEKPTDSYSFFKSFVESSIKNPNKNYDIYIYDSKYVNLYSPYLLDLNINLPKDHIELYNSKIIKETCTYKDKLLGLVIHINIKLIKISNKILKLYSFY